MAAEGSGMGREEVGGGSCRAAEDGGRWGRVQGTHRVAFIKPVLTDTLTFAESFGGATHCSNAFFAYGASRYSMVYLYAHLCDEETEAWRG